MDHNFLGLGKMSITYESTLSKDSNLRKKSAFDHRKIYLYKVKKISSFDLQLYFLFFHYLNSHMFWKNNTNIS